MPAVQRALVHLEVAGVQHEAGRSDGHARASGIEWLTAKNSQLQRAEPLRRPLTGERVGLDPVLVSFASTSARVSRRADQRDVGSLA